MDDYEFCGGKLHICYAPEYETIDDTRVKLEDRRRAVARRLYQLAGKGSSWFAFVKFIVFHLKSKKLRNNTVHKSLELFKVHVCLELL